MATPDHEKIERAYNRVRVEILTKLPDSIETREAGRLVDVAEKLTHEARERSGADRED